MGEYKNVPQEINDVVSDNIKKLAQLFPSAVKDGQLDVNALKEELGTFEEVGKEKYEFTWSGKQNAKKIAQQDVFGKTLKFCPEKSKNADTTENIYIEGDNLEALKLLRQNYYNSIKMIYIDPPYNTGNDFVYNDDYSMAQEESDIAEGVVDELGERYTKNISGNKFHANWCNMIYPRLKLAKDLLTDDGVIFISIDDNEIDNLKKICNEVFGEANLVAEIPWQSRASIQNDTDFSVNHEYICVYAKNRRQENRRLKESNYSEWHKKDSFVCKPLPLDKSKFDNPDNDPRGLWKADPFDAPNVRPNLTYPVVNPNTGEEHLPPRGRHWRFLPAKFSSALEDNRIVWTNNGLGRPQLKVFYEEKKEFGSVDNSWFSADRIGTSTNGTKELMKLFDGSAFFDTPKPVSLLSKLITLANVEENDIILDFFSGSTTTAHAVMQLNAEDGGHRKYIMVQLEEKTDEKSEAHKAGYNTICEIGEERICRAGDKIKAEHPDADIDIGFKVFEIANTNIKWNELELKDEQIDFANLSNNPDQVDFKQGTKDIDVVYEIMLRQKNIPLPSKIEVLDEIGSRTYLYADSYLICLETQVTNGMIDKLASIDPTPFKYIFRDSAFKDDIDLKTNAFRRLKAMVEKHAGATKKAYTVEFI
jgi:adenine-specific DNA-methyltransferase